MSTSSVVAGVVQDVENGNVNNSAGSSIGLGVQEILEKKIPIIQEIAPLIGFGASEAVSRNMGSDDVQE